MKNKLVVGDTLSELKKLPSNSIDMGVTSPPYNKMEKNKGWLVKNVKYDSVTDKKPEAEYQNKQIEVLNELFRVIKEGGCFFYNHKIRWDTGVMFHPMEWLTKTDWTIRQEIVWNRKIAANIRGWRFWQVDERIYWLIKPSNNNKIGRELESKHAKLTSIWSFTPENKNLHPAPFPVTLPLRCIASTMYDKKGVIIDPYCGSGTSCVAADILGHNYLGIDISENYIDMSRNRLKDTSKEKIKVSSEMESWKIEETFADRKKKNSVSMGKFSPKKKREFNRRLAF